MVEFVMRGRPTVGGRKRVEVVDIEVIGRKL